MSKQEPDLTKQLAFWRERAEGFQERINRLRTGIEAGLNALCLTDVQVPTLDDAIAALGELVNRQAQQGNTLRAYLWAVVKASGGDVTISDRELAEAFNYHARLKVTAPQDGHCTTFAAVLDDPAAPPAEVEQPRIITP